MCIDACEGGKDVYVEKPASHYIRDGRLMVEAARRNNRIVQVGTQQRSGTHFQRAVKYVQEGRIGAVHFAVCWNHSASSATGRGRAAVTPPPDLDYDMWLGPAPPKPFAEVWSTGRRYDWDFFGGMLTEWGAHLVDIVQWATGARSPKTVVASGGRFHRAIGEIPDTLQALYEFDGFLLQYSVLSHNTYGPNGDPGSARFGSYGIQLHGTKGTLFVDRAGFRITPQTARREEPDHPERPVMWLNDERQLGYYYTTECLPEQSDSSMQHWPHIRNFIDSVKTRKRPIADIEDGHLANTVCRLGNIAYRVGRRLRWDGATESVIDDPEANRLVVGTYRLPWIPRGL
jgi:predicted dehydrogenase